MERVSCAENWWGGVKLGVSCAWIAILWLNACFVGVWEFGRICLTAA